MTRHSWIGCVLALAGCAHTPNPLSDQAFSFALMGDTQYSEREEKAFPAMLNVVSAEKLAFVVHVGDFKAGSNAPCTDALFQKRFEEFNRSRHAFIYLPGDNEWTDCRRPTNGGTDPLERLNRLREIFYPSNQALGQSALTLQRQSAAGDPAFSPYRENVRWTQQGVVFVTVNIQGSNDNVGFDAANDREHAQRTRANIEWVRAALNSQPDNVGAVVFMQANPGFELDPATVKKSGYREFLEGFEAIARAYGKPILFAHGDTHTYRIDKPYVSPLDKRPIANVTRLETYGSPNTNWVRVTVDPANAAEPFTMQSGGFVAQP